MRRPLPLGFSKRICVASIGSFRNAPDPVIAGSSALACTIITLQLSFGTCGRPSFFGVCPQGIRLAEGFRQKSLDLARMPGARALFRPCPADGNVVIAG